MVGPRAARTERRALRGRARAAVSALGRLGFINAFANFPVRYLSADACLFVFPLSGTRILAVKEGGALDVFRCATCDGGERVPCPNCDGVGLYDAMGRWAPCASRAAAATAAGSSCAETASRATLGI